MITQLLLIFISGFAIGVAVVISIDLYNNSKSKKKIQAFYKSLRFNLIKTSDVNR
ncbi:hypothetical protein GCM10022393_01650 [Aquimarina addita]|uniref:Uncharacterized protein n=1 Tax=Aquimarina addita TaxID=870485 RepID=A0ABP7X8L1_9FLAO